MKAVLRWGERFGMTHFVNPSKVEGDLVEHLVELTGGGADYTFDATGNVGVMRTALEGVTQRLGWRASSSAWHQQALKSQHARFNWSPVVHGAELRLVGPKAVQMFQKSLIGI